MRSDKHIHILENIVDYCNEIINNMKRFGETYEAFVSDFAYKSSCSMCILQIGELVSNLSEDFLSKYNGQPWQKIRSTRNMLAHEYGKVNFQRIWETIEVGIPELKAYCEEILAELKN